MVGSIVIAKPCCLGRPTAGDRGFGSRRLIQRPWAELKTSSTATKPRMIAETQFKSRLANPFKLTAGINRAPNDLHTSAEGWSACARQVDSHGTDLVTK